MRIGIFGGTFDPPHVGHLLAALGACDALELDRLIFIPAAAQPLKGRTEAATTEHRTAMVELLAAADVRFSVDRLEMDRGGLSYTADTLLALRQRWPAGTAELVLLLGTDAAAQFPRWKDPGIIQSLARVVVLTRLDESAGASPGQEAGLEQLATRRVDVTSTEVRERVRTGKPIRGLVPDTVVDYIAQHGLYH
ncbi:MAG: nicotinate-nucleotide adenylyltransferase [Gemmatimonadetes bacterium]|nr:nicotinate-nucleotide adenylyltransferase [Gemmatimonadota bacterium]